jgi:Tfp pilus assembly protein PilO
VVVRADFSLARLPSRTQLAVIATFAATATIAFWYSVDLPRQARITAAAQELTELQRMAAQKGDATSRLSELRDQVMSLRAIGNDATPASPPSLNAVELLRTLTEHATDAGLFVRAFRPKPGSDRQPASDSSIALELEGRYHDFGTFLDRLRTLTPPIFVTGFSLRAHQAGADGILDIVCTVSGSWPAALSPTGDLAPASAEGSRSTYVYDHSGRRDPFVSLSVQDPVAPVIPATAGSRPDGLGGLKVEEAVVKGIVRNRGAWIALIGSSTGRTYSVRSGDRLLDGHVEAVTHGAVVFVQDADATASRPTAREVRKALRSEGK